MAGQTFIYFLYRYSWFPVRTKQSGDFYLVFFEIVVKSSVGYWAPFLDVS
jgi:hypothetical protein